MQSVIVVDIIAGDRFECQWNDGIFGIASYEDDTINDLVHLRTGFGIDRYSSKEVCINLAGLIGRTFENIDTTLYNSAVAYRDNKPYSDEFLDFCKWGENKRNHDALLPSYESKVISKRD